MNKVYKHRSLAPDEYLGRVEADGRVYESRSGPDKYVGKVETGNGKIYESRLGPDKHIGHVQLETGKVYLSKIGADEYLGRVNEDGKLYIHKKMAADEYFGKVTDMTSLAHGGAAFLLLVQPVYDEQEVRKDEPETGDAEAGQAAAPA